MSTPGYHEAYAADLEQKAQAAPTPERCADLYRKAECRAGLRAGGAKANGQV